MEEEVRKMWFMAIPLIFLMVVGSILGLIITGTMEKQGWTILCLLGIFISILSIFTLLAPTLIALGQEKGWRK